MGLGDNKLLDPHFVVKELTDSFVHLAAIINKALQGSGQIIVVAVVKLLDIE